MTSTRQLAAIMFTDIVGYTALMGQDEQKAMDLVRKNKEIQKTIIETHSGIWLKDMGDGAMVSFPSASEAVYAALAIQEKLHAEDNLTLRVGIHMGEVVFEEGDIYGDGVNIASRLETIADPGGIYISETVQKAIRSKSDIQYTQVGELDLKNVDYPVRTYALEAPFLAKVKRQPLKYPLRQLRKRNLILGVVTVVIVTAIVYFFPKISDPGNGLQFEPEKLSIAVMPFRNDSEDPQNIYFCNGMMEDVINQLARIEDVRVPSATSMLYYRDNPKPYQEIVEELQVSYLLEGSIRKLEDRALMNVTLIDAERNEQLWTDRYEMDLSVKGVWDVQFEVADQIIQSLELALTRGPKIKEATPTDNYEAYDNFLKARDLIKTWQVPNTKKAITLLRQSISKDPAFLIGYTEIAEAYGNMAEMIDGPWVDSIGYYAKKATELYPERAESQRVMAYYFTLLGDATTGLSLYTRAYELDNNLPYVYIGWCHWQLGNYELATDWAVNNIRKDPKNPIYYIDICNALNGLGLYKIAQHYAKEALKINPNFAFAYGNLLRSYLFQGDIETALLYEDSVRQFQLTGMEENWMGIIDFELGKYESALAKINEFLEAKKISSEDPMGQLDYYHLLSIKAMAFLALGDSTGGIELLNNIIKEARTNLVYDHPVKSIIIAGAYASTGEEEKALSLLDGQMGQNFNYRYLSQYPLYDPIRNDPKFRRVLNIWETRTNEMRDRVLAKGYF